MPRPALHEASDSLHFTDGKTKARRCKALCSSACKTPVCREKGSSSKKIILKSFLLYMFYSYLKDFTSAGI